MRSLVRLAALGALVIAPAPEMPARAEPQAAPAAEAGSETSKTQSRRSAESICRVLIQAATDNEIPAELFLRLIWQESRFDPHAVSPKGAQGIAQFMPGTASWRGLADPFEPEAALREAAGYLRELRTTFRGSLGLAVAAYNAGPGRVEGWLAKRRTLPGETRAYVRIVTGYDADAWASQQPPQWQASGTPTVASCAELGKTIATNVGPRPPVRSSPAWGPWGVQLTANWSEGQALATYERLRRSYNTVLGDRLPLVLNAPHARGRGARRYIIRVSETSRTSADALCAKLRAVGGACAVLRNPSR